MRKLVIAIDCDDVLIPTAEVTIDVYNRDYNANVTPDVYYGPATLSTWGTDDESVAVARVETIQAGSEFAGVAPRKETVEAINRLSLAHELHLVTGRPDHLESATLGLLDRYFPGCFTSVEHTNYYNEAKKRSKGEVCRQLGADVLVDDHLVHAESVLQNGLQEVIVFGDYGWNRRDLLLPGMTRCSDWAAAEREIIKIAGQRADNTRVSDEAFIYADAR